MLMLRVPHASYHLAPSTIFLRTSKSLYCEPPVPVGGTRFGQLAVPDLAKLAVPDLVKSVVPDLAKLAVPDLAKSVVPDLAKWAIPIVADWRS